MCVPCLIPEAKLHEPLNRKPPSLGTAVPGRVPWPAALRTLTKSLALIIGTESMVVLKDVLQLNDSDARKVRRWAIRALVDAARKSSD